MILSDSEIRELCLNHRPAIVQPFISSHLNPASLDVCLGSSIAVENQASPEMVIIDLVKEGWTERTPYLLKPGQFILAETLEKFYMPDFLAAQFMLKSSRAREGLEHLMAGYCDPGWHGSRLTMELHNSRQLHHVPIWPGMRIGQIVFHRMSKTPEKSYRITGRYNNDAKVTPSKGHC